MGEQALNLQAGQIAQPVGQGQGLSGGESVAIEAGVHLHVDGQPHAPLGGGAGQGLGRLPRCDGTSEGQIHQPRGVRRRRVTHHQDGRGDARPPELLALVYADDAQPVGARRQGGAGHRNGAVSVGVGFDHREQGSAIGLPLEQTGVPGHRVQVDLCPDGPALPGMPSWALQHIAHLTRTPTDEESLSPFRGRVRAPAPTPPAIGICRRCWLDDGHRRHGRDRCARSPDRR